MNCSVFIAVSLDGFIARPDGDIDWLERANQAAPEGEDFGYKAFFESVDGLVMGRNTFEKVLSFGEWPYASKPVVVLSRSLAQLPEGCPESVELSASAPADLATELDRRGWKRAYIDGGATIQSFLAAGLIGDLTITTIPVLLGDGIPLFGPVEQDVSLTLLRTSSFGCGFVQSTYRVDRDESA